MNHKIKVYGYLIREQANRAQVLVFDHVDFPEAGTQVPGGTVDPGEGLAEAVLREFFEEAGVDGLTMVRELGVMELIVPERSEVQERHFFHLTTDRDLPEEWVHVVSSGTEDAGLRFRCFWLDVHRAAPLLAGEQGRLLALFQ